MTRKITQKELKHDEFVEAAFDLGHWLERHWKPAAQGLAALALLVVIVVSWIGWSQQRRERARQRLADGIERYQAAHTVGGGLDAAILGESLTAFDDAAGRLGRSPSGRLASFYRAAALVDLGRADEAREALEDVVAASSPEETVGATALWLLARVEATAGRHDEALALLARLHDDPDALVPPDQVLAEMARVHEAAGHADEARRQWQRVLDEHPRSPVAAEARERLR